MQRQIFRQCGGDRSGDRRQSENGCDHEKCPRHCGLLSAGLSEVKSLKPVEFTITSPQINFTGDIFFMVVMNGNSAGGFRRLGVQSSINDGLLDVIIFKEMNFMELLPLAINVLQGRHDENKM